MISLNMRHCSTGWVMLYVTSSDERWGMMKARGLGILMIPFTHRLTDYISSQTCKLSIQTAKTGLLHTHAHTNTHNAWMWLVSLGNRRPGFLACSSSSSHTRNAKFLLFSVSCRLPLFCLSLPHRNSSHNFSHHAFSQLSFLLLF